MAKKTFSRKSSTRPAPPLKWWHLLLVVVCIGAFFFLLERVKAKYGKDAPPAPVTVQPPAAKAPDDYSQKAYTSTSTTPSGKQRQSAPRHLSGTMAVIVDDMGSSMGELKELVSINIPLTFAVIPGLAKSKAVAEAAHTAGRQVMVHLPMEPQGYPKQRLEANGLLVSQTEDEIVARTVDLVNGVPHARGANNHMGSRFTEHEEKMVPVMNVLRDRGLFFVDSRTSPKSTGVAVAGRIGVRSGTRNVFLDNEQDVAAIKKQLLAAAEMSKRKGGVIAICHPHPATIAALREAMPELQAGGIRFVPAAEIVR